MGGSGRESFQLLTGQLIEPGSYETEGGGDVTPSVDRLRILIITAAVAAPIFAEEFQHAGTAGYASGLPAVELERVYTSYRFENVTQREAEALFSSAVAAIYWPDRREVQLLSADRLEAARTWLALKARQ